MKARRRPLWKRLRYGRIFGLLLVIYIISYLCYLVFTPDDYTIEYVEYQVQLDDSLFNLVQDMNDYTPRGWDARDFVALAQDVNDIWNPHDIKAGQTILIPIAKLKEDKSCH